MSPPALESETMCCIRLELHSNAKAESYLELSLWTVEKVQPNAERSIWRDTPSMSPLSKILGLLNCFVAVISRRVPGFVVISECEELPFETTT